MPIIKNRIDFGHDFTMLPNQWVRDARLSHRARGVLAVVMSHRDGWETSISYLVQNGKEGRDAIYSAVNELVDFGYLRRIEMRSSTGKFEGSDYEVQNPFTGNQQPLTGKPDTDYPYSEKPYPANPQQEKNNLKKTISKENQDNTSSRKRDGAGYTPEFLNFWEAYPLKRDKGAAFKAWKKLNTAEHTAVMAGVYRYANDPNLEKRYTKYPASWLNARAWEDETPLPARTEKKQAWQVRQETYAAERARFAQMDAQLAAQSDWREIERSRNS